MIITQKKPIEEVLAMVEGAKTVALVGCNSCATACQTGGQPQIDELTKILEAAGKKVVATTICDYCCMNLGVKTKMKAINAANPDCVICMSWKSPAVSAVTASWARPAVSAPLLSVQRA